MTTWSGYCSNSYTFAVHSSFLPSLYSQSQVGASYAHKYLNIYRWQKFNFGDNDEACKWLTDGY